MKISIEIPDELVNATQAAGTPAPGAAAEQQPLSGGAAPQSVAVTSISPVDVCA